LIKKSKDVEEAKAGLMKTFKFSEVQALAILDMKLQKLAGLERKKIEDELTAVRALIKSLKEILSSEKNILAVIKDETKAIIDKYGDDRMTKIVRHGVKEVSDEDLIPDEDNVLVLTKGGYVKRTKPEEYRKQKRGGVGVIDLETKDEDFVTHLVSGTTHSGLLFFTNKGKAYQLKMYEIPEGKRATKGKAIVNFLAISGEEKITSVLAIPKEAKASSWSLVLITKGGIGKKVSGESFKDVRRSGIISIRLDSNDELISAGMVQKGDECILTTSLGQSIRFKESDIREMGRSAGGVRVMRLKKNDFIVGADVIRKDNKGASLLVVTENGFGKKTSLSHYKVQRRGGSGIKTVKITKKTGVLVSAKVVYDLINDEMVAVSKKGQIIRLSVVDIRPSGRQTQGVRIMRLHDGDKIASVTCL
jgi:DNA gyrase subunit A